MQKDLQIQKRILLSKNLEADADGFVGGKLMNGNITVDADRDLVLISNNTNLETTVLRDFPGDTGGIHGLMQGVHHRVDVGFFFSMMFALRQAPTKLLISLGLMSKLNPAAMVATHLTPMPCSSRIISFSCSMLWVMASRMACRAGSMGCW